MINTYQTSLAPPPVPPRINRSQPILIPTPLPSEGHSKPLIRFLVCVMVLHLLLSVGGFVFLYYKNSKDKTDKMEKTPAAAGMVGFPPPETEDPMKPTSEKALARMVVWKAPDTANSSGYLWWNIDHSVMKNINPFKNGWLTIQKPGDYYVNSRVTFSKGHPKRPLVSRVKLRENKNENEEDAEVVMQAYCSLDVSTDISRPCTATQTDVITLEEGNLLGVWVQDLPLVDYEKGATAFGIYKVADSKR